MPRDFLDELISESSEADPAFGAKVDAAYRRRILARRLAGIRKAMALTQGEVAQRMKSTQPVVSRIETGGDVRLSTLERYAAALGCALGYTVRERRSGDVG